VVFDIDGTLITTGGAGAEAWRGAFEDLYGIPVDITDYTEDGMVDHDVCRATYRGVFGQDPTENEVARLTVRYLHHLPAAVAGSVGYRVLPGVPELLDRLSGAGHLLGLTTGNIEAAAHMKLARAGLNRFFSFGGYGSDASDRAALTAAAIHRAGRILERPLDPGDVEVVGDTPRDVAAAHAVGAVSVAVATGHFTREQLVHAGADVVLTTLEDGFPI